MAYAMCKFLYTVDR